MAIVAVSFCDSEETRLYQGECRTLQDVLHLSTTVASLLFEVQGFCTGMDGCTESTLLILERHCY